MAQLSAILVILVLSCLCSVLGYQAVDIGAVHSCVIAQSSACSISCTVPESVANLTEIKDAYINEMIRTQAQIEDESCLTGVRQLLCMGEYPCCNERESIVNIPTRNCSQLLSTCTRDFTNEYCSFSLSNVALGECKKISEYALRISYTFTQCSSLGSDWLTSNYITEWSFFYLQKRDQQVNRELKSIGRLNDECLNKYRLFRCGSIGYCWDEGNRVKLLTNRNDCFYLRDQCLSNNQRRLLRHSLNCELWPDYIPIPSPSPTPNPTTSPLLSSTPSSSSQNTPSPPPDDVNSPASDILCNMTLLLVALLCAFIFL